MTRTNGDQPGPPPDPDQAWRVLNLVNEWIRHAETKATGVLAAAGVGAGVLATVLTTAKAAPLYLIASAVVTGIALLLSGIFATWCLRPKLWSTGPSTSRIYFDHIARGYPAAGSGLTRYVNELTSLTTDPAAMIHEVASQVWENARIASAKHMEASWGLAFVLLAYLALAITAVAAGRIA